MIISLVGFRGSGKSSVAPLLARRLDLKFVDADQEIERRSSQSIPDIFSQHGEDYFRQVEAETIEDLLQSDNLVVATGGGAILNSQTCKLLQEKGPVVWLQADAKTTVQRIQKDQSAGSVRPALTDLDFRQEIITLLEQRMPLYQSVSNIQIDTVDQSPQQIVEQILLHLDDKYRGNQ